jgi:hypothetical protein
LVLILSIILVSSIQTGGPRVEAAASDVSFSAAVASWISGDFHVQASLDDSSVAPGSNASIQATVAEKTSSLTLTLPGYGSHTITFSTPIGTESVPVIGIPGASVNVEITGQIQGAVSVSGPGSVSPDPVSWSSWGSNTIIVDASQAKDGDTISAALSLEYVVSIGVSVTILGQVTRILELPVTGLSGYPQVTARVSVSSSVAVPWLYIGIWIAVPVAAVLAGVAIYRKRRSSKKQKPMAHLPPRVSPTTPSALTIRCPYCGHPNRSTSRFCGKCGKRLS